MVLGGIDQDAWSLGLKRVRFVLDALSHPERSYRDVLVGGTNGKGSTCIFLERILTAGSLSVGTNLSPHIRSFGERFRINGKQLNTDEISHAENSIRKRLGDIDLTYFEWCVVLATVIFAEHGVDVGIFEVGLGGRLDASNAIDPDVSIITSISKDHTNYLGDTIGDIAREKAFIARAEKPLITCTKGIALDKIGAYASSIGAQLIEVGEPFDGYTGIEGTQQGLNAALALKAAEVLGVGISGKGLSYALNTAFLPGRIECIGRHIILDVAHNVASMLSLVHYLTKIGFIGTGVLGILSDKDYVKMTELFKNVCGKIYIAPVPSKRSWNDACMSDVMKLGGVSKYKNIQDAFSAAMEESSSVVVTGSFYTVGEVRDILICQG